MPDAAHVETLRRRAAELARVPHPARRTELIDALVFSLGGQHFAVDAAAVLQVAVLREFTPLPGAAVPLFGVTHWRGTVLTILDLRAALGVRAVGVTDLGRVIVLDGADRTFGVLADAVHEITEVDLQQVRALPDERSTTLLRGITDDGVLLIDGDTLLQRYGTMKERRSTTRRGGQT